MNTFKILIILRKNKFDDDNTDIINLLLIIITMNTYVNDNEYFGLQTKFNVFGYIYVKSFSQK